MPLEKITTKSVGKKVTCLKNLSLKKEADGVGMYGAKGMDGSGSSGILMGNQGEGKWGKHKDEIQTAPGEWVVFLKCVCSASMTFSSGTPLVQSFIHDFFVILTPSEGIQK